MSLNRMMHCCEFTFFSFRMLTTLCKKHSLYSEQYDAFSEMGFLFVSKKHFCIQHDANFFLFRSHVYGHFSFGAFSQTCTSHLFSAKVFFCNSMILFLWRKSHEAMSTYIFSQSLFRFRLEYYKL